MRYEWHDSNYLFFSRLSVFSLHVLCVHRLLVLALALPLAFIPFAFPFFFLPSRAFFALSMAWRAGVGEVSLCVLHASI